MKRLTLIFFLIVGLSVGSWATEEKVEVDQPSDPVGDIISAPFKLLGGIFAGGETVAYDPDDPRYSPYSRYYGWPDWDDPWYYDRYDYYRRYRHGPYFGYYYGPGYGDDWYYRHHHRHHRHHKHHHHKK